MTNLELVRIVEEQGRSPVGIPVLLFTDQTLAATGPAPALGLDRLDEPVDGPRIVIRWYDGWRATALFRAAACADLGIRAFFFPITRPQASGRGRLAPGRSRADRHRTRDRVPHGDPPQCPGHHGLQRGRGGRPTARRTGSGDGTPAPDRSLAARLPVRPRPGGQSPASCGGGGVHDVELVGGADPMTASVRAQRTEG